MTIRDGVYKLFLNGSIQFSSKDEYRYHEALVHPAMAVVGHRKKILILGGGAGIAARELLKYPEVENITIVDLDPAVAELFRNNKAMRKLNWNSLLSPKVKVINQDAFKFIENSPAESNYNLILIDLPDPQPVFARRAFWCIANTMASVNAPYSLNKKCMLCLTIFTCLLLATGVL
ncbi:MAG: hypothetical protein GY750_05660 [Lentisphaerae bacterium]|nr:hypothetical protein [Lentisphaerota bacterium]MCP4100895.1 hypothetical protein [Lentisphaerota bacterium]